MTVEQNRLALIEALSNGFKKQITTENIKEFKKPDSFSIVETSEGLDVVVRYTTTTIFEPAFDDDNYAQISFNVILKNCVYDGESDTFKWDGKEFAVDYAFEYNLMFACILNKADYDKADWVLQTFEQNFPDDKKVAICVLDSVFGAMTKNEFKEFGDGVYKDACDSFNKDACGNDNGSTITA